MKRYVFNRVTNKVKRKTTRQKVKSKEAKKTVAVKDGGEDVASIASGGDESLVGTGSSGRLNRKIAKQLRFFSKLQETQNILGANKVISKKKKNRRRNKSGKTLNDLSSLAEFLPSLENKSDLAHADTLNKPLKNKARQKLVLQETKQLSKVLAHPKFKSNPFTAIQQHLANTMASQLPTADKKAATKTNRKKRTKA